MSDETISEKCETLYRKLNTFVKKVINRDVQPQIDSLTNSPTNTSKKILENEDLNDYTEIGFYYSPTGTISQTLSNCPVSNAFALFVEKSSGYENACTQTITTWNGTIMRKFSRYIQTINGTFENSGWQPLYDDTGWQTVTITHSSFAHYNTGVELKYRRVGKVVELNGQLKNTASITLNATEVTVATLPTGYRPSRVCYGIMQGSGTNIWLLSVNTNGQIRLSRYRANTTTYSSISSGAWFPIQLTYTVN